MNQSNQIKINLEQKRVEQYRREKDLERIKTSKASNDLIDYVLKEENSDPLVNEKCINPNPFMPQKNNICKLF